MARPLGRGRDCVALGPRSGPPPLESPRAQGRCTRRGASRRSRGGASRARAPPRAAKDTWASARQQEPKALDDLLHDRLPAALARLRAAELPTPTTTAIRERLVVAARAKSRAITATPPNTRTAATAVRAALAGEGKAAALLGDAPGQAPIAELPIPGAVFGAFDMTLDPDGRSVWVSGPDGSRIFLYRSLEPGRRRP
jgi:hypothetical protein